MRNEKKQIRWIINIAMCLFMLSTSVFPVRQLSADDVARKDYKVRYEDEYQFTINSVELQANEEFTVDDPTAETEKETEEKYEYDEDLFESKEIVHIFRFNMSEKTEEQSDDSAAQTTEPAAQQSSQSETKTGNAQDTTSGSQNSDQNTQPSDTASSNQQEQPYVPTELDGLEIEVKGLIDTPVEDDEGNVIDEINNIDDWENYRIYRIVEKEREELDENDVPHTVKYNDLEEVEFTLEDRKVNFELEEPDVIFVVREVRLAQANRGGDDEPGDETGDPEEYKVTAIESFEASFVTGGTYNEDLDAYIWEATRNSSGHQFVFRVSYSLSGEDQVQTEAVQVRVPKHIIKDRYGSFADEIELSVPKYDEIDESDTDIDFVYREEADCFVIYNCRPISAASNGFFELAYATTKAVMNYTDMGVSEAFSASINVENNLSADTEDLYVGIDSYARLENVTKSYPSLYKTWQPSWGTAPEDAGDWFYLVWQITSNIEENINQPYNLTFTDETTSQDGEVLFSGYRFSGQSAYSTLDQVNNQTTNRYRYDYVLTKHKKSDFNPLDKYSITNKITVTLTPIDGVDEPTTASSQRSFYWERPEFKIPSGSFDVYKRGDGSYRAENYYVGRTSFSDFRRSNYTRYDLDNLKDGIVTELDNFDYMAWMVGYSYPWTIEEGGNPKDPDAYGVRPVTYELTDEGVYLSKDGGSESDRALTSEDFEIYKIDYAIYASQAEFDEEYMVFRSVSATFGENDIVKVYLKFGSNEEEFVEAGQINLQTKEFTFNDQYINSVTSEKIFPKENCVAYRFEYSNAYYSTEIDTAPFLKLKNSDYVMQTIADMDSIAIKNTVSGNFYDADGQQILSKSTTDKDFARIIQRDSYISKDVVSTSNNKRKKYYTITWKVKAYEQWTFGQGEKGYVEQAEGTFFDLLPAGMSLNLKSVQVKSEDGYLADNAYKVNRTVNYRNTGRELIEVQIDDAADWYELYFDTIIDWDSIKDFGTYVNNPVAYRTGNDKIKDGTNDDGGQITEHELMANLTAEDDGNRFIYADENFDIVAITSATAGLTKKVKADGEEQYSYSSITTPNGNYQYRLRYQNSTSSQTKNMIFFDSLENYDLEGDVSDWHGTLESIDLSQARALGIEPAVYISTVENLNLDEHHDLTDSEIWTLSDLTDLSSAKAIAVDLRVKTNGDEFVLNEGEAVNVILNMVAPAEAEANNRIPVAYNNIYISDTVIANGRSVDFFIHHDYTSIRILVDADFNIRKISSEDGKSIRNIKFRLLGTSDYGTEYNSIVATDKDGYIYYKDIEKGSYVLSEYQATADWIEDHTEHSVLIDGAGEVYIDDVLFTEQDVLTVENKPRVHADISIVKMDDSTLATDSEPTFADDVFEEGMAKYAVSLYGIGQDVDENGNNMGLTFGPALGTDYVNSYKSHTASGTTSSGNAHRCIHNDSWEEIIYWNLIDPDIYEDCIAEGCTHSIDLRLNETLANQSFAAYNSGDGPSMLYQELLTNNTNYQHLEWNPLQATGSTSYGNNVGGWGVSRIRAMLNGADSLTQTGTTYGTSVTGNYLPTMAATDYNSTNSLLSCFPTVLQNAIGSRKTIYHGTYNSNTQSVCYDKLFLLSQQEVSTSTVSQRVNEGTIYQKFASGSHAYNSSDTSRVGYRLSGNTATSGSTYNWWLRSPNSSYASLVCYVNSSGNAGNSGSAYSDNGVSPAFALSRNVSDIVISYGTNVPDWLYDLAGYQAQNASPSLSGYVSDTKFKLSGVSEYGTEYAEIAVSDKQGSLKFSNIEQGTYEISEVQENPNYIKDDTVYTVTIDENGQVSSDMQALVNRYVVYNTPKYWQFPLRKVDAQDKSLWLQGAVIEIKGVSDSGSEVDLTYTSDANGLITIGPIEKGTYYLKEVNAPFGVDAEGHTGTGGTRNYNSDPYEHIFTVSEHGKVMIDGLSIGDSEEYELPNDRALDKTITVYKKWNYVEGDTLVDPQITLTTYRPTSSSGFYTLKFDANGSTFDDGSTVNTLLANKLDTLTVIQKGEYKEPELIENPDPDYYESVSFVGWKDSSGNIIKDLQGYSFSSNQTLTAEWKLNAYPRYAVSLYGIGQDIDENGNTMGLTFGPALGAVYVNSFKSHTPSGQTSGGHEHRCLHDDDWETIIYWNGVDPDVYEDCIAEGCTHSVVLKLNDTLKNTLFEVNYAGDGPSMLYQELLSSSGDEYQHIRWNPINKGASNGTNVGGWGASRIRAMMNGADSLTMTLEADQYGSAASYYNNLSITTAAEDYGSTNSLLSCFPAVLQNAIGSRKTIYHGTYNSTTQSVCYDKLFLLSQQEVATSTDSQRANEGTTYQKFASGSHGYSSSDTSRVGYKLSGNTATSGSGYYWELRSPYNSYANFVYSVSSIGDANTLSSACSSNGVSPAFALSR